MFLICQRPTLRGATLQYGCPLFALACVHPVYVCPPYCRLHEWMSCFCQTGQIDHASFICLNSLLWAEWMNVWLCYQVMYSVSVSVPYYRLCDYISLILVIYGASSIICDILTEGSINECLVSVCLLLQDECMNARMPESLPHATHFHLLHWPASHQWNTPKVMSVS